MARRKPRSTTRSPISPARSRSISIPTLKIASVVHGYQAAGRDIDYINHRNELIRAVTRDDVNRVARRLFDPDAFTFVVVGQPEGLEAAASQ